MVTSGLRPPRRYRHLQQTHADASTANQGRAQLFQDGMLLLAYIPSNITNFHVGDGGTRAFQTAHPFFLMIMHSSSGHGVLVIRSKFALEHWSSQHLRVEPVSSTPHSGYHGPCLIYISEHLQRSRRKPTLLGVG